MKILVFDDTATHRAAAQAQLKDYDLTVVGTYDEAHKLLATSVNFDKAKQIMVDTGIQRPDMKSTPEERRVWDAEWRKATEQATSHPDFDVVLTDLLVRASDRTQGPNSRGAGEEMPVGVFIALLAAKTGAKYAAVFTDSDHHSHPASACFDPFNDKGGETQPTALMVEGCKVFLVNNRNWVDEFDPNDLLTPLTYDQAKGCKDTVRAKNWKALLDYILAQ